MSITLILLVWYVLNSYKKRQLQPKNKQKVPHRHLLYHKDQDTIRDWRDRLLFRLKKIIPVPKNCLLIIINT